MKLLEFTYLNTEPGQYTSMITLAWHCASPRHSPNSLTYLPASQCHSPNSQINVRHLPLLLACEAIIPRPSRGTRTSSSLESGFERPHAVFLPRWVGSGGCDAEENRKRKAFSGLKRLASRLQSRPFVVIGVFFALVSLTLINGKGGGFYIKTLELSWPFCQWIQMIIMINDRYNFSTLLQYA